MAKKRKHKNGAKVVIARSYAEWLVNHCTEIYSSVKGIEPKYYTEISQWFFLLSGKKKIVGVVRDFSPDNDTYLVDVGFCDHWYDPKDIKAAK